MRSNRFQRDVLVFGEAADLGRSARGRQAYDGECLWCEKPVAYTDVTIDHVIPETLQSDPARLKEVINLYCLGDDFNVNSFRNWAPCHAKCNSLKGARLFKPSPAMVYTLDKVARRSQPAEKNAKKALNDREKSIVLGKLEVQIEQRIISRQDIRCAVRGCRRGAYDSRYRSDT